MILSCTIFNLRVFFIVEALTSKVKSVCNRKEKAKAKDGKDRKTGRRERRSRKPAAEEGAPNSITKEEGTDPSAESQANVERRGPTIPRNTGQRYSAVLSPQGAQPKHHITFASPH